MKLFLVGGYSYKNPGDDAILKSTVYFLQDLYPSASFYIWTNNSDFTVTFDRPVSYETIYWQPLVWIKRKSILQQILVKLYTDLFPFSKYFLRIVNLFDRKIKPFIEESDKVICVGGGYMNSSFNLLEVNYMASLALKYRKPVFFLGQTLGPFRKSGHRRMADEVFKGAEKIILRDSESLEEISHHTEKSWHGTDDAVTFAPILTDQDKAAVSKYLQPSGNGNDFYFGINLREWSGSRQYYPQIAAAVEAFARSVPEKRIKLIFIPMEASCYCDDRRESDFFSKHLSSVDYAPVAEDLTTEQKFHLISRLDIFVGMRLHSLIFALTNGVPAIGLYKGPYYRRKISGVFESFQFKKNTLDLDQLEKLESLIGETVSNRLPLSHFLLRKKERLVQRQRLFLKELMLNSDNTHAQTSKQPEKTSAPKAFKPAPLYTMQRLPAGRNRK